MPSHRAPLSVPALAEAGYIPVRDGYVSELLAACGLPEDGLTDHPGVMPPPEATPQQEPARLRGRKPRLPRAVYH